MAVRCPKCGREADDGAVICAGCDFILDSSFLGDDIMDAEADRRVRTKEVSTAALSSAPAKNKKRKRAREPAEKTRVAEGVASWAADALILGDLDDDEVASFQASDTGLAQREVTMARMYVGGSIQALLMPDAIPEIAPDVALDSVRITPFERHVLELVNGKRPVARIKVKARLKDDDFQTALALLADKGFLRLKGRAKKVPKRDTKRAPQQAQPPARSATLPRVERTLIAEAPSAHELDDVAGDADEARGFEAARTGPARRPTSDGELSHTQLQPAPRFDDDDEDDGPRDSLAGPSVADDEPLSFADSIISEEGVFASAEEAAARDAEPSPPVKSREKRRARRRPPLPGEIPAPPPELVDEEAPVRDIHDEPTSDTHLARPSSSFASAPPPLPLDASREAPPSAVEDEAVAFEDLETAMPSPLSVDAADISLIEVDTLPLPEQHRPAPPPPASSPPDEGLVEPPHTDPPAAIEVSDFSDPEQRKLEQPATPPPPLPGASLPPPLPGAPTLPPPLPGATPPAPSTTPALAKPPAPPAPLPAPAVAAPPEDKSEEEAHDSDSGEGPDAPVSFEMQRKASRIFEQAEKDFAAGNVSSAIMNVKLALIYNPVEKRYRQFLADWEAVAVEPKAAKETKLLDDAQEAEQRGDYEKAFELLSKALERAPRNAGLHNRIGVLLATRLKRYKEAAEHVLTAIELAPGNLAYKNNLGKILAKEESAIHKMPMKKERRGAQQGDDKVVVKKLRPKLF